MRLIFNQIHVQDHEISDLKKNKLKISCSVSTVYLGSELAKTIVWDWQDVT